MITCRLSSSREGVAGCIERKKDSVSLILNEPLLAFLKAILVCLFQYDLLIHAGHTVHGISTSFADMILSVS